jgi:CNT family concentrative nucleoside transporter
MKKLLCSIVVLFLMGNLSAQNIDKQWIFNYIHSEEGTSLYEIDETSDTFTLDNGAFEYSLAAKNNLKASGDYIFQNNLLVLFYSQPTDTIRRYRVTKLTEDTLSFTENNTTYWFKAAKTTAAVNVAEAKDTIIPSQGFSFNSLWRGVLGMVTLLFIAFLFSANRTAISWRSVGLGLALLLVIAVGVLIVAFIQKIFEGIG